MNSAQTLDSPLNIEQQNPAMVSIYPEGAFPLHRLCPARRREGISLRNVAQYLGVTMQEVRRQECETTDMPLSVLHKWAKVLGLPMAELVQEPGDSLSTPLVNRAHLVLVMKTAMAILERTGDPQTERLAQTMVDQLMEIMPELRGVTVWHVVGASRRFDELGVAAERRLSDEVFMNAVD